MTSIFPRIAICLVPEAGSGQKLDAAIHAYARQHNRAAFNAHLSIVAGADPAVVTEDKVAALARDFAPVKLARDGIMRLPKFTRAFALNYAPTPQLMELRAAAERLAVNISSVAFLPHLSLTYGQPPDVDALNAIADAFEEPLVFDALETNIHREPDTTQDDIAAFRQGPRHRLTGAR